MLIVRSAIVFALTVSLFGAEVRLSPDTPVSPGWTVGPAAFDQSAPEVASNGHDYLAVWVDWRSRSADNSVFATRIGEDGRPVGVLGKKLAEAAEHPHIAPAGGGDYLVAFSAGGSQVLRVDENGDRLGPARKLNSDGEPRRLLANGTTYLLINYSTTTGRSKGILLDRDGALLKELDAEFEQVLWAGVYGGRYVIIDGRCCTSPPKLHVLGETGNVISRALLPVSPNGTFAAAASPDRILVASRPAGSSSGSLTLSDYQGNIAAPTVPLPSQLLRADAVGWDGDEFLVTRADAEKTTALRVSADGVLRGAPFVLASKPAIPSFASNGGKQLLFWSDQRYYSLFDTDVVARAAESFAALETASDDVQLVSQSPPAQFDARTAQADAGMLAVWLGSDYALEGSLNGARISIRPRGAYLRNPSVAAGKRNFLVTWYELETAVTADLLAKRIGFDGRVLDDEPLVLAKDISITAASIGYDGSSFWVATSFRGIQLIPVSDEGVLGERRSIGDSNSNVYRPEVVWSGGRVQVVHVMRPLCFECRPPWSIGLDGREVFAQVGNGDVERVVAAAGPEGTLLAWMSFEGTSWTIRVAQLTPEGDVKAGPRHLLDLASRPEWAWMALVWNGTEYVLAWSDQNGATLALRLDRNGNRIDDQPFEALPRRWHPQFSLAPSRNGAVFAYEHPDPASHDVTRAFLRTLERDFRIVRRPSVRH